MMHNTPGAQEDTRSKQFFLWLEWIYEYTSSSQEVSLATSPASHVHMRPPNSASLSRWAMCVRLPPRPQSLIEATNLRFSLCRERSSAANIGWTSSHNAFSHHILRALASLLGRDGFKSKPVRCGVVCRAIRRILFSLRPRTLRFDFSGNFRSRSQAPLSLASLRTLVKRTLGCLHMCFPPLR